jgi:hypothetical protein
MESFMTTKQTRIKKQLQHIIDACPNSLRSAVATEALSYEDDIESFFHDLLTNGCQSGIVATLIYYCDTHKFYDEHYHEIEQLREELEDAFGEPLRPKGDLKNWFAWLAFEETARAIADEFGLN